MRAAEIEVQPAHCRTMAGSVNRMQSESPIVVMSISEFDPSGQAGTIADLKTFAAHGCYGVAAITALTLEQPGGKLKLKPLDSSWLKQSILSNLLDQRVRAVKVGMLHDHACVEVVCEILKANPSIPVVFDPVLADLDAADRNKVAGPDTLRLLLPLATVVTSSPIEAAALTGLAVRSPAEMKVAAARLVEMDAGAAVVTGGRFEKPFDIYSDREVSVTLAGERFKVDAPHETGSTFSSAIAANLALGRQPHDAVVMAKAFVTEALRKAFNSGSGRVLLNHFYRTHQTVRSAESESEVAEQVH